MLMMRVVRCMVDHRRAGNAAAGRTTLVDCPQ
jgi:hypothetical protein